MSEKALPALTEQQWQAIPEQLHSELQTAWSRLADIITDNPECAHDLLKLAQENSDTLPRAIALSDFLAEAMARHVQGVLPAFGEHGQVREWEPGQWPATWEGEYAENVDSEEQLLKQLRRFRRRAMFSIIWRDVLKLADLDETMASVSELADTCIQKALSWLYQDCCAQWGVPHGDDSGEPQSLVVVGMGKLGAHELNVSSDIDLIFAFEEKGETRDGPRTIDNQQFFTRLGQRLIQALDQPTADGFVFRVDMRLRPYGQSGALALSFPALEAYYQEQGREWERYAMIKARVIAGAEESGEHLMEMLRPFVYRRYIDFSAFESLRSMKAMINREVRRKGLENDIKLGAGGIREVEFVAQAFQLIRGGRDARLRRRDLLGVLEALGDDEPLPSHVVAELSAAYRFLRDTEHALQDLADRQTQLLPDSEVDRCRVATIMGFDDWETFKARLDQHRAAVSGHFADIIAVDEEDADEDEVEEIWHELWLGELEDSKAREWLEEQGFEPADRVLSDLQELQQNRHVTTMQSQARNRLDHFMPSLLKALSEVGQPAETFQRVLRLVHAVLRRTAYLLLLNENPKALQQLVRLCAASPWIANELASTPLLLDELLNAQTLYTPPEKAVLEDELRQQLLRISEDDLEEQMECLRYFKKAHVLRVAASEIADTLPLMKVSDYLTWIAEAVLDQVVRIAWMAMVSRYGKPSAETEEDDLHFAVVGYGKLGGIELGYTSDLDLVYIHDADPLGVTDGGKSIDNAVFFTRLGQRIVHILSTQTPSGQLYEVDMRLRPSGSSGLLVTTLDAFERYQQEDAWTWEHQALARSRFVAGSARVGQGFERIRKDVLCRTRDPSQLRKEVVAMRNKMRDALATKPDGDGRLPHFHVKQDPGGIIDIEFMVQYLILAHAAEHPEVTRVSDNIRQMETLGRCGVLEPETAERLREIFIQMRSMIHRQALQNLSSRVEPDAFPEERGYVEALWQKIMEPA
ncbi:bifunctional [glutamate--ammonia ligase]-adenylyl-L-tyrosine phosphorylase/[glutamate--ammonia-ligase] adenylyltransferase [Marinobacteraceae bacterium S3BR75-40.1]